MVANDVNTHHRHIQARHDETTALSLPPSPQLSSKTFLKNQDHEFGQRFMMALNIAGVAVTLLVTVFSLFYVDVFLRVYRLPLHSYSTGNLVLTVVNTTNDLLGAWLLDAAATRMNRSDLIGISGALFALCFL
jgi:hypothetical protein